MRGDQGAWRGVPLYWIEGAVEGGIEGDDDSVRTSEKLLCEKRSLSNGGRNAV